MQQIKDILHFDGQWRSYQKRVLDKSTQYLQDKRIHIVAAPGSGKTTLGIELIRRLNAPALILSPSINIRNQWISRIREAYIPEGRETDGLLSCSMKEPGVITAITYQALHSGMTKKKKKGSSQEQNVNIADGWEDIQTDITEELIAQEEITTVEEEEDYSDFDFFNMVEKNNIKTICLDEAHHLRSEWWKALEEMVGKMTDCTIISLTATPPYDSSPALWERYIGLCGPIDEEIIVPELVKEGSLCPHQDYVYFNMPTQEEEEAVKKFAMEAFEMADSLFRDEEFTSVISTHKGLKAPMESADFFLQNPEYLSSLLIFLRAKNISFSKQLLQMLGNGSRLPAMSIKWMEVLLQGFLYVDTESYRCTKDYRENLIGSLKAKGLIQKNTICLTANDKINKLLMTSKGKLNSIIEVTRNEYETLRSDLRLLILTDFIKKDYIQTVGNEEKSVNELGVVPIFETIRRTFSGIKTDKNTTALGERITAGDLRMGVLSGSVVIIPVQAQASLQELMDERLVRGSMKELADTGYFQVNIRGSEHTASSLVTELFNRGKVRVLIGTKSLLGEGWDSPCINSLILASFVGSFMLSNQMRGRAIRVMRGNPNKVSNIWHLICMQPESVRSIIMGIDEEGNQSIKGGQMQKIGGAIRLKGEEETKDFTTLKRRFEGFLGVHYEKNSIESGLQRLSYIKGPYTASLLEKINGQMLAMAANRSALKKKWENCLVSLKKMEVAIEVGASKDFFKTDFRFFINLGGAILFIILFIISLIYLLPALELLFSGQAKFSIILISLFWGLCAGSSGAWARSKISYLFKTIIPKRYMKAIGNCMLKALKKIGVITSSNAVVSVDEAGKDGMSFIYLKNGSEREKDVFAKCIHEFFGTIDNQRYLLEARYFVPKLCKYYNVPELFGKRKEDAKLFHNKVKRYIGKYDLYYTKSREGKQLMLAAKVHSLANKNTDCISKKKVVKNV